MKSIIKTPLSSLLVIMGFLASMPPALAETSIPASEIRIRDPFILPHRESGLYYMYAQRKNRDESLPNGVEVYWSEDLKHWAGPEPVFEVPDDFWATSMVWAPEVHRYDEKFYLFVTFTPHGNNRGTQVLVSDSPRGPFKPFANKAHTPADWQSLDGTLYVEEGQPYMVFCHEWLQVKDGTMELVKLTGDLSDVEGEPVTLFKASEAPWSKAFGEGGDSFVTDGPFLFKSDTGNLLMIWSTFGDAYNVGMAISETGKVAGPWRQLEKPLFGENGGHGMIFRSFEGDLLLALHRPNTSPHERLNLFEIEDKGDRLEVVEKVVLP